MTWGRRTGKFNNRPTAYGGRGYASIKEANYARELDLRVKAGELSSWERQVHIPLKVGNPPTKICTYVIDFVETYPDGHKKYTEIKGIETDVWRIKYKLFRGLHPDLDAQVIR